MYRIFYRGIKSFLTIGWVPYGIMLAILCRQGWYINGRCTPHLQVSFSKLSLVFFSVWVWWFWLRVSVKLAIWVERLTRLASSISQILTHRLISIKIKDQTIKLDTWVVRFWHQEKQFHWSKHVPTYLNMGSWVTRLYNSSQNWF